MRVVLENLSRSIAESPRDVVVLAVSWARPHLEAIPGIQVIQRSDGYSTYRLPSPVSFAGSPR
jgi:hypothetical protein